jgi:hypothetical protein
LGPRFLAYNETPQILPENNGATSSFSRTTEMARCSKETETIRRYSSWIRKKVLPHRSTDQIAADPLPEFQKRPGLNGTPRQCNGSYRSNFSLVHWLRPISAPCNSYNTWSHQNRQALFESNWQKKSIPDTVPRPFQQSDRHAFASYDTTAKNGVTLTSYAAFDHFLMSRSHVQGVPTIGKGDQAQRRSYVEPPFSD